MRVDSTKPRIGEHGVRIDESDLRFANTLTWNTFPVPEMDETAQRRIIDVGKRVLEARALYPERSLVDHYNPLAMTRS